jgi:hypothetical protein
MARRLIAANARTTVWDRSPSVTKPLREAGAQVASSPDDAVRNAAIVITMLQTADVVTTWWTGRSPKPSATGQCGRRWARLALTRRVNRPAASAVSGPTSLFRRPAAHRVAGYHHGRHRPRHRSTPPQRQRSPLPRQAVPDRAQSHSPLDWAWVAASHPVQRLPFPEIIKWH